MKHRIASRFRRFVPLVRLLVLAWVIALAQGASLSAQSATAQSAQPRAPRPKSPSCYRAAERVEWRISAY